MHVTRHALARRHGARELVAQRMSRLVLRNRFVAGDREAGVAVLRVAGGVQRIAIVGVDDVASRAAATSGSRRDDRSCRGTRDADR